MRLGIDLGTTRTVVARVDRGNYPVLTFTDHDGDAHEHLPSVVARVGDTLVHGFDALTAAREGAPALRSFKRILGDPATTPHTVVDVGGLEVSIADLLADFLAAVHGQVLQALAEAGFTPREIGVLEVEVSVPAHAHTTQRYLTLEAFRRAGFHVLGLVNEPSAAGFEFSHRQTRALSSRRTQVLVYDLGGGTFDASLVEAEGSSHEVVGSVGVNRLGGDDFDVVLAETVLAAAGEGVSESLSRAQWRTLLEECCEAKERLTPQTRRLVVEVAGRDVVVAVEDFYERAAPLVRRSVEAMEPLVGRLDDSSISSSLASVAGMYLVGGASGLPLVSRVLRETFGRRVHRSPYPAAATAIGLAIAADPDSPVTLRDRLSRSFGVFREGDGGATLAFDEIFAADVEIPSQDAHTVSRRYRPAHDLGVFRYVEYTDAASSGLPTGELVPVAEVRFPFAAELQGLAEAELASRGVNRLPDGADNAGEIEESYTITPDGRVSLSITDLSTGHRVTTAR